MAELAGLALGVAGLAGLFSTCIDVLNRVESAQAIGTDFQNSRILFKSCRVLLEDWGQQAGITTQNPRLCESLQSPKKQQAVYDILASLEQLFADFSVLEKKYGIHVPTRAEEASIGELGGRSTERNGMKVKIAIKRKAVWAIRDKKKFEDLVSLTGALVGRLRELVPAEKAVDNQSSEIREAVLSLHCAVSAQSLAIANKITQTQRGQQAIEEYIKERDQEKDRKDAMRWLNAVSCQMHLDTCIEDRVQGSSEWILKREAYMAWKNPTYALDRPEVFWCYGGPGAGKTFLAASITDDVEITSSLPTAYFFAVHEDVRKRQPLFILRSWIHQLASQRVQAFEAVLAAYNKPRRIVSKALATEPELWDLFSACLTAVGRCYLVLDGVDELSNEGEHRRHHGLDGREGFLSNLFSRLQNTRAHLIITSRDVPDIRRQIRINEQREYAVVRRYALTNSDTADDVLLLCRRIVRDRLRHEDGNTDGDTLTDDFKEHLAQKLAGISRGSPLWAVLTARRLNPGRSEFQLEKDIGERPEGLESAYKRDIKRISELRNEDKQRALEILRWTVFAAQPLTVDELATALSIDTTKLDGDGGSCEPGRIDSAYVEFQVLRLCGSLVQYKRALVPASSHMDFFTPEELARRRTNDFDTSEFPTNEPLPPGTGGDEESLSWGLGVIRLSHFSVKEFLLSDENELGFHFDERQCHTRIMAACLAFLTANYEKQVDLHGIPLYRNFTGISPRERLYRYCETNLPYHVSLSGSPNSILWSVLRWSSLNSWLESRNTYHTQTKGYFRIRDVVLGIAAYFHLSRTVARIFPWPIKSQPPNFLVNAIFWSFILDITATTRLVTAIRAVLSRSSLRFFARLYSSLQEPTLEDWSTWIVIFFHALRAARVKTLRRIRPSRKAAYLALPLLFRVLVVGCVRLAARPHLSLKARDARSLQNGRGSVFLASLV